VQTFYECDRGAEAHRSNTTCELERVLEEMVGRMDGQRRLGVGRVLIFAPTLVVLGVIAFRVSIKGWSQGTFSLPHQLPHPPDTFVRRHGDDRGDRVTNSR
jgi:hypothetical protein